jgi:molybdopterin converting factor small subunit
MSMEELREKANRTVRILLHARAAELSGKNEVDIAASAGATIAELKRALAAQVPALALLVSSSAMATDREYLGDSALVGDEGSLHLIPPVSGG